MVLRPAWNVHTAFMRFPIDVVFLDSDQVVVRLERDVGPWRTASCRGAREVVELAAGECERRGLEVGDRVAWASRTATEIKADRGTSLWADAQATRASVLVASRDPRFVKLARFLLEGRDLEVQELTTPERLPEAVVEQNVDLVLLDGGSAVADALRTANAVRVRCPDLPVAIAADAGGRSPTGLRVFDRWNETEELLLEIERLLAERDATAMPTGTG